MVTNRRKRKKTGQQLPLISVCTGAGGLDIGLSQAGFSPKVCIELDSFCNKTVKKNHKNAWPIIERDMAKVPTREILDLAGVDVGEAGLLAGGPPCQPFSKSGYWARTKEKPGGMEDPRADAFRHYLRILEETLPKAFLLENVFGFIYKKKSWPGDYEPPIDYMQRYLDGIEERTGARYSLSYRVVNTADYGVPQVRERVVIIGLRDGAEFEWPEPTHYDPEGTRRVRLLDRLISNLASDLKRTRKKSVRRKYEERLRRLLKENSDGDKNQLCLLDKLELDLEELATIERVPAPRKGMKPWVSSFDAIGDLDEDRKPAPEEEVNGKWGHLLPAIPPGFNYLYYTEKLGADPALFDWRKRYWTFLLKLNPDRPSSTIQAQPGPYVGPFHWRNRRLSVMEMKRLMTFPDDYEIVGPRREVQRQLGNAVPCLLAEVFGRAVKRQISP